MYCHYIFGCSTTKVFSCTKYRKIKLHPPYLDFALLIILPINGKCIYLCQSRTDFLFFLIQFYLFRGISLKFSSTNTEITCKEHVQKYFCWFNKIVMTAIYEQENMDHLLLLIMKYVSMINSKSFFFIFLINMGISFFLNPLDFYTTV